MNVFNVLLPTVGIRIEPGGLAMAIEIVYSKGVPRVMLRGLLGRSDIMYVREEISRTLAKNVTLDVDLSGVQDMDKSIREAIEEELLGVRGSRKIVRIIVEPDSFLEGKFRQFVEHYSLNVKVCYD